MQPFNRKDIPSRHFQFRITLHRLCLFFNQYCDPSVFLSRMTAGKHFFCGNASMIGCLIKGCFAVSSLLLKCCLGCLCVGHVFHNSPSLLFAQKGKFVQSNYRAHYRLIILPKKFSFVVCLEMDAISIRYETIKFLAE